MVKNKVDLKGVNKVSQNLSKSFEKIKIKSCEGMIDVAILLRGDMERTPPLIPLDTGNLRASFFATISGGKKVTSNKSFKGKNAGKMKGEHSSIVQQSKTAIGMKKIPSMVLGFTANYAASVHENKEGKFYRPNAPKGKKGRPGAGAKFFEKSLYRNKDIIIQLLGNKTKIK